MQPFDPLARRRNLEVIVVLATLATGSVLRAADPVNSQSTLAVREVLDVVYKARETHKILAGQHVYLNAEGSELDHLGAKTGRLPAIAEFDLLGFHQEPKKRDRYLEFAKQWYAAGGLIGISWHETSPALQRLDEGGYANGTKKRMSQHEFDRVLTPGTELHQRWIEHVDKAAVWLKRLQREGIVVLWRPYHEMTGAWFWWGAKDPESFRRLWKMLYDRLTNHHELNNLIWVWSAAQAGENYQNYLPLDCVDISGVDIYQRDRSAATFAQKYGAIRDVSAEKPVALTEVGLLPLETTLAKQAPYVWFILWGRGFVDQDHYGTPGDKAGNDIRTVTRLYEHPMVITRSELNALRTLVREE